MEDFVSALNDIEVSSTYTSAPRSLPPPGAYTVVLSKVEPSLTFSGNIRREYGRPLFEIEGLSIKGPFPYSGNYKLWQTLPMSDIVEFGEKRNYLRDLVRAYDKSAEFSTATEAFEIILEHLEAQKEINVRLAYFAEDYKGLKAAKEEEGLNAPFAELSQDQLARRNELEKQSKVKGLKAFEDGDGGYIQNWTSPFGNVIPVRLNILKFYTSDYDPFNKE